MYEVMRRYSGAGAPELVSLLEQNKDEVKRLIQAVRLLLAVRTDDGGVSVTVCQDKDGIDEASGWCASGYRRTHR